MSKPRKTTQRNRIRGKAVIFPPCAPGKQADYVFETDDAEKLAMVNESKRQNRLAKLRKLDANFAQAELEYLRARCKALQAVVDADRAWLKKEQA